MRERRKALLLNAKFKFRLVGFIVILMLLWPALIYFLIYHFMLQEVLIPQAIIKIVIPAFEKVNVIMLILAPIVITVMARLSIRYANRVLGPLSRIERELEGITQNQTFGKRIKIRKEDEAEVHKIVGEINTLLDKMQDELKRKT